MWVLVLVVQPAQLRSRVVGEMKEALNMKQFVAAAVQLVVVDPPVEIGFRLVVVRAVLEEAIVQVIEAQGWDRQQGQGWAVLLQTVGL